MTGSLWNPAFGRDYVGSETGFLKVSRWSQGLYVVLKYPVPVSKIESGRDRESCDITFLTFQILDFTALVMYYFFADFEFLNPWTYFKPLNYVFKPLNHFINHWTHFSNPWTKNPWFFAEKNLVLFPKPLYFFRNPCTSPKKSPATGHNVSVFIDV